MPDPLDAASPRAGAELGQIPGLDSMRNRPPDPHHGAGDADRVPLRPEAGGKSRKRESRLGLRNIFTRHKGASDADGGPGSPRGSSQRPGGIRASLAEISWPYSLHQGQGHRSEISLPSFKSPPAAPSLRHKTSASGVRPQPSPDGLAAWNAPPLFQAYPQAIKHAHLPACTASADVVLRMHHHKINGSLGSLLSLSAPDMPEEVAGEGEKPRRRHRRNASVSACKLEWTSKVFILVTSGYLLQYAGEGAYDRLPEKVLQLGKHSAAFASDVIPGRHWVLQVSSSVAESDRTFNAHSALRPLFPFRTQERRHSSTILMVFESAEDMDSWIATLRCEIKALGGRKVLSETGKPNAGGQDPRLRTQASQRTLVLRDPDRFSRLMTPDQSSSCVPSVSSPDLHIAPSQDDAAHDQSPDDTSTASGISHDGRQLDALRDSTNRFSFISLGQRTMLTSAGSSPVCSPVRESFLDPPTPELRQVEDQPQPRLRPNAMAIIDRRQSLQAKNHVFEMRVASAQSLRPLSTSSSAGQPDTAIPSAFSPQSIPDFTATDGDGKRSPFTRNPSGTWTQTMTSPLLGRMSARRPPPSALSINSRPLSLVEDQPSPDFSQPSRPGTGAESAGTPLTAPSITPPVCSPDGTQHKSVCDLHISAREASEVVGHTLQRPGPLIDAPDIPRSRPSLGIYETAHSSDPTAPRQSMPARMLSFSTQQPVEKATAGTSPLPSPREVPRRPHTPCLRPGLSFSQHLRTGSHSQTLPLRRIISQLAEGPPPAPPPNKPLPPVPRRASGPTVGPPLGFI